MDILFEVTEVDFELAYRVSVAMIKQISRETFMLDLCFCC